MKSKKKKVYVVESGDFMLRVKAHSYKHAAIKAFKRLTGGESLALIAVARRLKHGKSLDLKETYFYTPKLLEWAGHEVVSAEEAGEELSK